MVRLALEPPRLQPYASRLQPCALKAAAHCTPADPPPPHTHTHTHTHPPHTRTHACGPHRSCCA